MLDRDDLRELLELDLERDDLCDPPELGLERDDLSGLLELDCLRLRVGRCLVSLSASVVVLDTPACETLDVVWALGCERAFLSGLSFSGSLCLCGLGAGIVFSF